MTRQQGSGFVSSFRLTGRAFVLGTAAFAMLTGADAGRSALFAQGKLEASYSVTLAGLPIGRGAWVIDIGEDSFTASASGATPAWCRSSPAATDRVHHAEASWAASPCPRATHRTSSPIRRPMTCAWLSAPAR